MYCDFGGRELRAPRRKARFGLGNVGLGDFADVEAIAALAQLLLQNDDVAPVEVEQRRVAQEVHVGGGGLQQQIELGQAQRLAPGGDLAFRLPGSVRGLKAVVKGLRGGDVVGLVCVNPPISGIEGLAVRRPGSPRGLCLGGLVLVVRTFDDRPLHGRPISGQSNRHTFVSGPQCGALSIEGGVVHVGLGERARKRVGECGGRVRKPAKRGGNRKRAAIASATARRPGLLSFIPHHPRTALCSEHPCGSPRQNPQSPPEHIGPKGTLGTLTAVWRHRKFRRGSRGPHLPDGRYVKAPNMS